jgi:hypothetical protein
MPDIKALFYHGAAFDDDEGNLQKLITDATPFEFVETPGHVKLFDTVVAGGFWYGFEFIDGPFAGRKIMCTDSMCDEGSFRYAVHASEDGFVFNVDPAVVLTDGYDDWGGDFLPEWNGQVFYYKGDLRCRIKDTSVFLATSSKMTRP